MNLFRKAVASVALATLVVSTTATGVSAYTAQDVAAANGLAAANVINDHSADPAKYELARTIMRGEAAKVAVNLDKNLSPKATCENEFQDVTATTPNTWVCGYAEALLDAGKVSANAKFNPLRNISKSEAVKMMLDAAGCTDFYSDVNKWQEQTVAFANANGIAPSFTDYNTPATRAFVFSVAYNAMNTCPIEQAEEECNEALAALGLCELANTDENTQTEENNNENTQTEENNNNVNTTAGVKLSPETPVDGEAPANTPRTALLAFDVTAGDEDLVLSEAELKYTGLSNPDNVTKLAIYLNGDKVTKGTDKRFDSKNKRTLSFEKDTVVKAGETKTFFVTATLSGGTVNESHQVTLVEVKTKDGTVLPGTPLVGATLNPVAVTNKGALELTDDTASEEINVGEEVKLAGFKLKETTDKEDVILKSVTLTVSGSVDTDDLADLKLLADGKVIADNLTVNSDDEIVASVDYTIPADERVDFELKGVVTGSVGDTIELVFEDPNEDIYAIGASTKVAASIDVKSTDIADVETIKGAEINVSFDKADEDEAKPDTDDVLVGTLKVSTDSEDYSIEKLQVVVKNTSTSKAIKDIIEDLKVDGTSYDSVNGEDGTGAIYTFNDIDLVNGELTLPVTFDVEDDTTINGSDLEFEVKIVEVKDDEENKTYTSTSNPDLNDILSSTTFDKKTISIETAELTINSVDVNTRNLVLGNGVETVAYKAKINVGDADSVKIKDIKFVPETGTGGTSLSNNADLKDIIDTATLNIGGKTFDGDVNANDIKFSSIDAVVEAGADNVEVLLTLTLKDSDKIENGDVLVLKVDTNSLELEDSDGDELEASNIHIDAINTNLAKTVLLDRGTFTIKIKNDPDTDDDLENTVLAGSSDVVLAEFDMEAKYEDVKVKEINFDFGYGDFSNTIDTAKIVNSDNGETLVDGAVVTYDAASDKTIVTFKNDFVVKDADDLIHAEIVADLNKITGKGDETSAIAGSLKLTNITAKKEDIKGVDSNDELLTSDLDEHSTVGETVTIVPTILRFAVIEQLSNGSAKVKITADSGENTVGDSDEVPTAYLKTLTFVELGNTNEADAYKLYKEGEASNIITAGPDSDNKVVFDFSSNANLDNSFDTSATYIIQPKSTKDVTYSLVLSGDVAKYDVADSDKTVTVAENIITHLNSDISLGSRTY